MNSIIENVIISPPDQGKKEIDIRDIDMTSQKEVIQEIDRLKEVRMNWNKNKKPPPDHIVFEDYGLKKIKQYRAAKDKHYKDFDNTCDTVEENIKNLQGINTQLCIDEKKIEDDIKIKEGTFYNADEQQILDERAQAVADKKKEKRKEYNANDYANHKGERKRKADLKKIKNRIALVKNLDPKMIYNGLAIKPLCQCGRLCDVHYLETIKEHSVNIKHKLFKSVLKLIHYRRQNKRLLPIIKKINKDYIDYKSVIREKIDGKSRTITNKPDREIVKLYTAYIRDFDENKTHLPRESYIEKKDTSTEFYQDSILICRWGKNYLTKNK